MRSNCSSVTSPGVDQVDRNMEPADAMNNMQARVPTASHPGDANHSTAKKLATWSLQTAGYHGGRTDRSSRSRVPATAAGATASNTAVTETTAAAPQLQEQEQPEQQQPEQQEQPLLPPPPPPLLQQQQQQQQQ